MEFVHIGCRLPAGLKLEVGVVTQSQPNPVTGMVHVEILYPEGEYETVTLKGTSASLLQPDGNGGRIMLPSRQRIPHAITKVPKAFWERWKKEHANTWYFKSGNIFEEKDQASAQAHAIDHSKDDAPMQPLDPKKPLVFGDNKVEVADFHGKTGADRG